MKKLICALLLLAMLVPVMAMAEELPLPPETIDLLNSEQINNLRGTIEFGSSGISYTNGKVSATYYMTGVLRDYEVLFNSETDKLGVSTVFTPDGNIQDILRKGMGPSIMWNRATAENGGQYWFMVDDPDAEPIESLSGITPQALGATTNPFTKKFPMADSSDVEAIPPENIEDILEMYGIEDLAELEYVVKNHIANPQNVMFNKVSTKEDRSEGKLIVNLDNMGDEVTVLINGRIATYATYENESGYIRDTKADWDRHFDPNAPANAGWSIDAVNLQSLAFIKGNVVTVQRYETKNGETKLKGTKTSVGGLYYTDDYRLIHFAGGEMNDKLQLHATYYADSGEREIYFIYGDNYNTQTAYDKYNRMVSHEYWDSAFCYWGYFDGAWMYSPSGGKEAVRNDRAPTTEVLKSLVETKAVAEYPIGTSGSAAGLPSILDSGSSLGGANITVTNELEDDYTTKYDIAPKDANGDPVEPDTPVRMYLPLPAGMDVSVANNSDIVGKIVVLHDLNDSGTEKEAFSTDTETMQITDQGLLMVATSYSPYRVIWGAEAEKAIEKYPAAQVKVTGESTVGADLPSTGDNSNLMLFVGMLAVSAAALLVISKRRAHQ